MANFYEPISFSKKKRTLSIYLKFKLCVPRRLRYAFIWTPKFCQTFLIVWGDTCWISGYIGPHFARYHLDLWACQQTRFVFASPHSQKSNGLRSELRGVVGPLVISGQGGENWKALADKRSWAVWGGASFQINQAIRSWLSERVSNKSS